MNKLIVICFFLLFSTQLNAYCEVEPDGDIYCSDRGYVGEVERDGSVYTYDRGYSGVEVEQASL